MNTELIKKYTAYSTRVLQKMATVKAGEELEAINTVLTRRGQLAAHPDPEGAIINPTETPQYEAENGITEEDKKAWAKAEKEQAKAEKEQAKAEKEQAKAEKEQAKAEKEQAKAEKELKPLKKARTKEEAEQLYVKAIRNKGFVITVKTFRGHQEVTGTIIGARLDPRSNFVQYRIRLQDGTIIGKGVDNPDILIAEERSAAETPVSNGD